MTQAQRYQQRVAQAFARFGEAFTLTHDGADRTLTGVFAPLDATTANVYFDPNEAAELVRPGLVVYLDGTVPVPSVGDTLTRDGRLYQARRVDTRRVAGVPLVVIVILD